MGDGVILTAQAEVAELADAQDLGSCGRKAVWVQLPPSALPLFKYAVFCVFPRAFIALRCALGHFMSVDLGGCQPFFRASLAILSRLEV